MARNLVIVESPAKAKTIEKFLGKDFSVKSSYGHIRDLPSKGLSVDIDKNFKPSYEISPDKKKIVSELKSAVKKADTIWLASDEDREGEAIAWHLTAALKLDPKKTKRIVFHEITKPAIEAAIKNPRDVDQKLVDAQQARRVLDRLVGYQLSPVLWKKIQRGLSAGRVQSVAVRLIVEREREVNDFDTDSTYKVNGSFTDKSDQSLEAELDSKPKDKATVKKLLEGLKQSDFEVDAVTKSPSSRSPSAPFTTSTLQQEASRRLGYSVKQTMTLAQRLYESGHITYMRTDSTNLSETAIDAIKKEVIKLYGQDSLNIRAYKTKVAGAQEAHEAIRPTDMGNQDAGNDPQQKKLYSLIRQRTLASQMATAKLDKTTIKIKTGVEKQLFVAKGEIIVSPGWLEVYPQNIKETTLPPLSKGDKLDATEIIARQNFSRPPARYTEASLVRKLEEMGIGRPSTYAPTISTIQDRGYIIKGNSEGKPRSVHQFVLRDGVISDSNETENYGADKNKLLPTDIASVVNDFLVKYFSDVLDYDFTADIERQFDDIADGKKKWQSVLKGFYGDFKTSLDGAADVEREEAAGHRDLGVDPKDKKPVIARVGRYGPMLQKGRTSDDEKPVFSPLPEGATLETVTLEQALPMFALPRTVGKTADGKEITASIGRFGPYVKVDSTFVSIKGQDPLSITEAEARELIDKKIKEAKERIIQDFTEEKIQILNGRYGPYITDGSKNAKIPKETDPKSISLKEAKEMLKKAPARRKRGRK